MKNNTFDLALKAAEGDIKLQVELSRFFMRELHKAMTGRICTDERMAKIYPIIREINDETDATEEYWMIFEARQAKRVEKKAAKLLSSA